MTPAVRMQYRDRCLAQKFARDFKVNRVGTHLDVFAPDNCAIFADGNLFKISVVIPNRKNAVAGKLCKIDNAFDTVGILHPQVKVFERLDGNWLFHRISFLQLENRDRLL